MLKFEMYSVDAPNKPVPMEFKSMGELVEFFGHGEYSSMDSALVSGDGVQKLKAKDLESKFALLGYVNARDKNLRIGDSNILSALGFVVQNGFVNEQARHIAEELNMGQSMSTSMGAQKSGDHNVFLYHFISKDRYRDMLDDWMPHKELLEPRDLEQGSMQYENIAVLADPDLNLIAVVDLTGEFESLKELRDKRVLTKGPVIHAYPSTYGESESSPLDIIVAGPQKFLEECSERIEFTFPYGGPHSTEEEEIGMNTHDVVWAGYCNSEKVLATDNEFSAALRCTKPNLYHYPDSEEKLEVYTVDRKVLDALGAIDSVYYSSSDIDDNDVVQVREGQRVAGMGRFEDGSHRIISPEEMRTLRRTKDPEGKEFDVPW